jgi:competence protein ComEC
LVTRKEILHCFPFFRIVLMMIPGLLAGMAGVIAIHPGIPFLAGLVGVPRFLPLLQRKLSYKSRWIPGVMIFLLLIALSFLLSSVKNGYPAPGTILKLTSEKKIFVAEIIEPVIHKTKSVKAVLQIIAFREEGRWIRSGLKVSSYIQKDSRTEFLFSGDRLIGECFFTEPGPPVFPGGFDNRRYLSQRGIFLQAFISHEKWMNLPGRSQNFLFRNALLLRSRLLGILRDHGMKGQQFAVAAALLLGYVDEIDSGVMKDYAATGVMHILSVSGMHVGMIFLVLNMLLSFLDKWRWGRILKAILSILLIWIYAMITGLSPAVLRAAAMLSFLILGKCLNRTTETLNILAASFFFLLIWEPNLLSDMGFQLSYLSVAGIVLLYESIYRKFNFENWFLDKIWAMVAVSLAAQLATAPLSLYYFQRFPNYFLLANLLVVPFSNLIIYDGILALLCNRIPVVSGIFTWLLSWSVGFLNDVIHFIGSLPGAVMDGIFLGVREMILVYAIIICTVIFLKIRKSTWMFVLVILLIFLQGSWIWERCRRMHDHHFFVYNIKKIGLYDFVTSGKSIMTGDLRCLDDPFISENLRKSRNVSGTRMMYRIRNSPGIRQDRHFACEDNFFMKGRFFQFWGKRIGIIQQKIPHGDFHAIRLDWLIISGNPKLRLSDICRVFTFKVLIIDGSNPMWKARDWLKEASEMKLDCRSVALQGTFEANF